MFVTLLIAGGLLAGAGGGVVYGMLAARAKTRAVKAMGANLPEVAPEPEPSAATGGDPFRTAAEMPEEPRKRPRGRAPQQHDYDLMIGRTFFR